MWTSELFNCFCPPMIVLAFCLLQYAIMIKCMLLETTGKM